MAEAATRDMRAANRFGANGGGLSLNIWQANAEDIGAMRIHVFLPFLAAGAVLGAAAVLPWSGALAGRPAWSAQRAFPPPDSALQRAIRHLRPCVALVDVELGRDSATGTGFVVRSDGYLLTNAHVIRGGHNFSVRFASGLRLPARVVRAEPEVDLALLHVDARDLTPVRFAPPEAVAEGEDVGAMGYPLPDTLEEEGFPTYPSTTQGIINAIRPGVTEIHHRPMTFLQTDARINDGNSGGPLFSADTGDVVGIVQSEIGEHTGINLAIPADDARRFLQRCRLTLSSP